MIEHRLTRSICHASVGTQDLSKAKSFYTPLLATLDIALVSEYEHAVAYGKGYPEFWVQIPFDKQLATAGNGIHFGFVACTKKQVDEFYQCGIERGAKCNGAPGHRPEYGKPYYGCFLTDLDGNKIEASYWQLSEK